MPSVLIVDDLLSIHQMLDAVIQPTGFSTAFAIDGETGLERYRAEKFDLVLADIDMKPMDGITLLQQLKLFDPHAVVIIMTAYANTDSAVQALKFGAFDFLQKPFRVDELLSTLKRALASRPSPSGESAAAAPSNPAATVEIWPTLQNFLAQQEQDYIHRVIAATGGDKPAAATILGVTLERLSSVV